MAVNILERTQTIPDASFDVTDLPHAASGFAGINDRLDVQEFAARGRSPTPGSAVYLDNITVQDSLSQLDPKCPGMVRNLIINKHYRYIVNLIGYAPSYRPGMSGY